MFNLMNSVKKSVMIGCRQAQDQAPGAFRSPGQLAGLQKIRIKCAKFDKKNASFKMVATCTF